jgi:hypothetical protein
VPQSVQFSAPHKAVPQTVQVSAPHKAVPQMWHFISFLL